MNNPTENMDLFTYSQTQMVETMTVDEARRYVDEIKSHVGRARSLLLELYERRGWESLGYTNWRECVVGEFGQGQRYLYYQLQAAEIEKNLCTIVQNETPIPESHLRPLAILEPDQQRAVWQEVVDTAPEGKITAAFVQSGVDATQDKQWRKRVVHPSRIHRGCAAGYGWH